MRKRRRRRSRRRRRRRSRRRRSYYQFIANFVFDPFISITENKKQ